jgi:glycosyltransferase involved in cell wall biosynthesis
MYGIDCTLLEPLHAQRLHQPGGWPRRFLFAGRYVEEKGLDVLIDGYARYRRTTNDPWPLTCCGSGPMNAQLTAEGVENLGFVQPQDLAAVMARAGAFVLPSRYDPWPLVIAEACAAGLPVICTEACGSAVELVRNLYSGWTVPTEDAASLARAMASADRKHQDLPEIGRRAQSFAAAYSAPVWADRWKVILTELSA